MVQFNLLPDVKIEYIKTRTRKRQMMLISTVVSGASLAIFVLLFLFVRVNQPKHISDLDKDIKTNLSKIQETPDLDKILTIQNQLNSLPALHDKKVVGSRTIDYMTQLTPTQATISGIDIDFDAATMSIKGEADGLLTVNKFVDTLKFTDFKVNNEGGASGKAFKDVVLTNFSVSNTGEGSTVTYEINMLFDPLIYAQVKDPDPSIKEQVTLTVPKITSTRSETEKPSGLFEAPEGGQQ